MQANDPSTDAEDPTALQVNLVERVCVGDLVGRTADVHPQAIAIVDGKRRLDYATLDRQVTQLGHALLGLGLQHQDVRLGAHVARVYAGAGAAVAFAARPTDRTEALPESCGRRGTRPAPDRAGCAR